MIAPARRKDAGLHYVGASRAQCPTMRAGITHSQATRHSRCLYGTGRPRYVRGTSNGDDCNVEASIGGGGQCGAARGMRRVRPQGSQAEMPIVRERITTTVTHARKRDIRLRHNFSIGACGRSCSVDRHLKTSHRREPRGKRHVRRRFSQRARGRVGPLGMHGRIALRSMAARAWSHQPGNARRRPETRRASSTTAGGAWSPSTRRRR